MKIVYITRYFWPTVGGAAAATLELARRLANRGHEVSLFAPDSWHPYMMIERSPLAAPKGLVVSYSRPRLSNMPADTLSFVFLGFKALRAACGANVIVCQHHQWHWASFCAAILSMVARKPLVVKVHDIFCIPANSPLERILSFVWKWTTWLSLRRAKLVLVPGEELVDRVRRVYGLEAVKVGTLLNGVNTTRFSPRHRSDDLRGRIGSKHIVVFVGNVENAIYRLDVLIRATGIVRIRIPDIKILIIGDGPDRQSLTRLTNSLRLEDCIQFLGLVTPELIPAYLASADVGIGQLLASVSTFGATPLKVVEYMASGCVAVVGKGGASEDLIIDGVNGIVAKSADVADLASGILRIFSDQVLAARLSRRARETVEKLYNYEVIVSELEEILRCTAGLRK